MNEKDAYIKHLENTILDLQNQVSNLTEMILLLRKEKFGSSSEKTTSQLEGQLSLFNEAEIEADADVSGKTSRFFNSLRVRDFNQRNYYYRSAVCCDFYAYAARKPAKDTCCTAG